MTDFRQHWLDFERGDRRREARRKMLAEKGLSRREIDLAGLFDEEGRRAKYGDDECAVLTIGQRKISQKLGWPSPTTARRCLAKLEARGVLRRVRIEHAMTYALSWTRLGALVPPRADPLETIELFEMPAEDENGHSRSHDGPPPRDSVRPSPCKIRDRDRDTVPRDTGDAEDWVDRLDRPWHRDEGVDDELLGEAVIGGQLRILRRLFDVAVELGWIADSEDARLRFLTIAHHAATSAGLRSRMGALVARVRRDCDVRGTRHQSEDWAARVLARSRQTSEVDRGDGTDD